MNNHSHQKIQEKGCEILTWASDVQVRQDFGKKQNMVYNDNQIAVYIQFWRVK